MLSTTNILIQTLLNTKTYSTTFEKLSSLEGAKTLDTLLFCVTIVAGCKDTQY